MVRHPRFKSSVEAERVSARGYRVATPAPLVRDVTGSSFPELVRNFTRKYSDVRDLGRVHVTLAPVFKYQVVHPNGTTRRYRSAIEARSSEGWSRREMETFMDGLVPGDWREGHCPTITKISQAWDEKTLPPGSYARQLYREYVLRNRQKLASNDARGWENLFKDARSTAWAAAQRHPNA
jgi:hypothetical protein